MHRESEHQRERAGDGFAVGPRELTMDGRAMSAVNDPESTTGAFADHLEVYIDGPPCLILGDEMERVRIATQSGDELTVARTRARRRVLEVDAVNRRPRCADGDRKEHDSDREQWSVQPSLASMPSERKRHVEDSFGVSRSLQGAEWYTWRAHSGCCHAASIADREPRTLTRNRPRSTVPESTHRDGERSHRVLARARSVVVIARP